jgi:hypothetical protein
MTVEKRPQGDLGSFPQTTPKNPSQANGNSPPAVPPSHRQSGMDGSNGPAPPYFPK